MESNCGHTDRNYVRDFRAYADSPAANGYVPISPETLRSAATTIEQLARYIVRHHDGRRDGACAECCPYVEMPAHIRGFRCAFHVAKDLVTDET